MYRFKKNSFCFCVLLVWFIFPVDLFAATSVATDASFVSVADIHFDPFYSCDKKNKVCPLINKLAAAPATKWPSILSQYDTEAPRYKEDTNEVLFKSTLNELKKIGRAKHAQFVLVLGDFLSHNYKKNYQYYTGDTSEKGVEAFIDKTMQFITSGLAAIFPNIDVYMIVGNNDAYGGHYTSQPAFYKNIAPIWSRLIRDKKNHAKMQEEFAQGGYYALDIQRGLRLIVLNTAYFSTRGVGMEQEAQCELNWLEKQLALLDSTQKAVIAFHIPNLAAVRISQDIPVAALGLWRPAYIDQFLNLLKSSAPHIMVVLPAHLHMDWAQLLQFKGVPQTVAISATPSISPVVGNNPGFKIYYYDPENLVINDYLTYFYPLEEGKWKLEYAFNETYQPDCNICTLEQGLKQLQNSTLHLEEYRKFFSVARQDPIFSNLIYPAPVCDLHTLNYTEYTQCVIK